MGGLAWRILSTEPLDGATNMSIDEAVMTAFGRGLVPPTIRFFTWSPPCLSLGRMQNARTDVDLDACHELGIEMVRRPTGGRAILHDQELTYSVVASQSDPLVSGRIVDSYRKITAGLIRGLKHLGIEAEMRPEVPSGAPGGPYPPDVQTAACFDSASAYEVIVGGRKLIGSAQMRSQDVLLQHGSILVEADVEKMFRVLRAPSEGARAGQAVEVGRRLTCINRIIGREVPISEIRAAMTEGFREALGVKLEDAGLCQEELRLAAELRETKYATDDWNLRT